MSNVVVIGKNGQLARSLMKIRPDFVYLSRDDINLEKEESIHKYFQNKKVSIILNLAAYTNVDLAESEKEKAEQINAISPALLANYCDHFVYISTDYVFDGKANTPYKEDHKTSPINTYGETKLKGEVACLNAQKNTYIIRTSWLYSEFGQNFLKTMLRLSKEMDTIKVVNDQIGIPTYAGDLAEALNHLVKNIETIPNGIYHFSNSHACTWFDFAKEILANTESKLLPIKSEDFPTKAVRPKYSVLCTNKIEKIFSISIKPWKESLQLCLKNLS